MDGFKYLLYLFLSLVLISCSKVNLSSPGSNLLKSNREGLEILVKASAAHGDVLSDTVQLGIYVSNKRFIHPGQSLSPMPPFEYYSWDRFFFIDYGRQVEVSTSTQVNGGYTFEEAWQSRSDSGFYFNFNTSTFRKEQSSQIAQLDLLPQTYIRAALKNKVNIRVTGKVILNGRTNIQVDGTYSSGYQRMWIDEQSGLISKVETIRSSYPYGDA